MYIHLSKILTIMKKFFFVILSVFLMPATYSQSTGGDVHTDHKEVNIRFENRKKKGYYNTTQIGMLMGNRQISGRIPYYYPSYLSYVPPYYFNNYTRTELQFSPSVTMTNGYMFNEHWAAGIGVGFEIFDRNLFPVFADIRYTLWDAKISPFFAVKTGYAIGNLKKKHYENQLYFDFEPYYAYNADLRNYGGFMLHPEMGVKVPLGENADLMFTVAYRYQKTKTKVTQKYDYAHFDEWKNKASLNRLSFGVAIMFR
jgi:hypothetical protein